MRRFWTLILLATVSLAGLSCTKQPAAQTAPKIESGDLLFVGIPMHYWDDSITDAIAQATAAAGDTVNFIHTAILEVDPAGGIWVIDATLAHGVDRHPLDTMLADFRLKEGNTRTLRVMRLTDNRDAVRFVEQAKGMLGEGYDLYFKAANGLHYCTELVYDTYVDAAGKHLFESVPMNFKNKEGEMPAYWTKLFATLGEPVPQGQPGTNPQMMIDSPQLIHVLDLNP